MRLMFGPKTTRHHILQRSHDIFGLFSAGRPRAMTERFAPIFY